MAGELENGDIRSGLVGLGLVEHCRLGWVLNGKLRIATATQVRLGAQGNELECSANMR